MDLLRSDVARRGRNSQVFSLQLVEIRRLQTEFSKKHQMEEELTRELDECHLLLQSKEADCTRLAKNLGASQVREAEQEAKWMQEVQKVKKNLEFKNIRQQQEVCCKGVNFYLI